MRIGAAEAPPILFIPPLFEEMNRTRALLAAVMRRLARQGFGCWLPDLPGTGESEQALENCDWKLWRSALAAATIHIGRSDRIAVAAIRGGCLLDDAVAASCYWRFAPVDGASLRKDLVRSTLVGAQQQIGSDTDLAGYRIAGRLLDALEAARPAPLDRLRTVRLASDRADADHRIAGSPLWRRSEPASSPELSQLMACDLKAWIAQCAAC